MGSFFRYVDISINSVVHRAPVVSAITLTKPTVRLVRETEEQFNISDLIEKFSKDDEEDDEDSGETLFSISNITIEDGHFELIDQFEEKYGALECEAISGSKFEGFDAFVIQREKCQDLVDWIVDWIIEKMDEHGDSL